MDATLNNTPLSYFLELNMNPITLGLMTWWSMLLGVFFTIVCMVMIVIVLLQKGRGGGLSAAFGGAGGQSAFGSKTGDVFTWATIVVAGLFLLLAMICTVTFKPSTPPEEYLPAQLAETAQPIDAATSTDTTAPADETQTEADSAADNTPPDADNDASNAPATETATEE